MFNTKSKSFTIVMVILTATVVADISFSFVPNLHALPANLTNSTFLLLASIFAIASFLAMRYIRQANKDVTTRVLKLNNLHRFVEIVQYILAAILMLTALQVMFTSEYATASLIIGSSIGYGLSIVIMASLSALFLSWYKSNKNLVILAYGFSSAVISIAFSLLIVQNYSLLYGLPAERNLMSEPNQPFPNEIMYLAALSSAVGFFVLWFSTALLLNHYATRLGRIKFWTIMSIPIFLFVIQFTILPQITEAYAAPYADILYVVLLGNVMPAIITGILFGLPFWIIQRTIRNDVIKKYMYIAAWGSALLQLTTIGGVYPALYPPFGLYVVLLTGLACYLLLIGIYSSALTVSIDAKLRRLVRTYAIEKTELIDVVGNAQMKKEIEARVLELSRQYTDEVIELTGVHPSLTEHEMKQYVENVVQELTDKGHPSARRTEDGEQGFKR
ncbi:MAG TPA: hypothetical protein VI037_06850 [Nitrososphaera sp.]|jgi:MFS family permease